MSRISTDWSLREFRLGRPQFHWINFRMETWSICTCEMYAFLANGEITIMGTRTPRPWLSTVGGGTWSYQPPPSSQITTMALSAQAEEFCTELMKFASQLAAMGAGPEPGCMSCAGAGCTKLTEGRFPVIKSP